MNKKSVFVLLLFLVFPFFDHNQYHLDVLVNAGITLDIFVSVMVLGMFVNRIGNTFEEMDVDNLTNLKD